MKRILLSACVLAALPALAQETYQNATLAADDLNGTARYVGMGGAMDALGADISTMGSNPAGIGLFRKSNVSATGSVVMQSGAEDVENGSKTVASFDQIGFVVARQTGANSFFNFGFNYHKNRNFNQILTATNVLGNGSQNILTYASGMATGKLGADPVTEDGVVVGYKPAFEGGFPTYYSQLDALYNQAVNFDPSAELGDVAGDHYYNYAASEFAFGRAQKGYIGEYDFNLSGNIKDRVYLGLTMGIRDVHYRAYTYYTEGLMRSDIGSIGDVNVYDERKITGSGFNVKAGVIVRPIENSPFRIGVSVATPTFYSLKTENYTVLYNNTSEGAYDNASEGNAYDFKLYTPWKFGVSLGHTIGNYLALGASYEYEGFDHLDSRVELDGYYDWYGNYQESSASDNAMNNHTEKTLKGVSTIKLGVEYKPLPELALRAGYNYVSPMYNKNGMMGYSDSFISSYGRYYSSTTDYTNWKATHRITAGIGYTYKNFTADLAYQFNTTKGDFYPFQAEFNDGYSEDESYCSATSVDFNRHQLMLTLGYRF